MKVLKGKNTMNVNVDKPIVKLFAAICQHYNPEKYWKMREEVVNSDSKKIKIVRWFYLYRIKRSDAFQNASMGTDMGAGAFFETAPILPHHLNGIIISHYAKFGKNVTIFQQVTVAQDDQNRSATIGDNVIIGAGAKIIGNITIGDNVKIGANCVVTKDIPSNVTAVGVPARIVSA